mgnify:CR=1 FL=1
MKKSGFDLASFGAGQRIVIGERVIAGGGEVRRIGPGKPNRSRALGDVRWMGASTSAVLFIGQAKGREPVNRTGKCATAPAVAKSSEVDYWFNMLRAAQVGGKENVAGTRTANRGWYKGQPEPSMAFQIFHDPSVKGEKTVAAFEKRMKSLAEDLAEHFCQDEVIVTLDRASGKKTSYGMDRKKRTK